jgi:DNA-binding PadR family transcriptional regulator
MTSRNTSKTHKGAILHTRITSSSHPFDTTIDGIELTFGQFFFLLALDRLEQSKKPYEADDDGVASEMERLINGSRTFGYPAIYQFSDEMMEKGFTREQSLKRPDGKQVTSYQLTPQGHLHLGRIYEQNSKKLEPYRGLAVNTAILQ